MQISFASDEAKEEFNKIKETEKNVDREKLFYKSGKNKYNFKRSKRIRTFGEDIYNDEITFEEADEDQANLLDKIYNFISSTKPQNINKKKEKEIVKENLLNFYMGREVVLNAFRSKIFSTKSKGSTLLNNDNSKLKILTPKQMLQRFSTALAQVKGRQ